MNYSSVPTTTPTVFTRLPEEFRATKLETDWANVNAYGKILDSFLEAPVVDKDGMLYVADIPYGRVFRINAVGDWQQVIQYPGEPNGMKFLPSGDAYICDFLNGLMKWNVTHNTVAPTLIRHNAERFKGLNDLTVSRDGDVYFTDQGQTGLHDRTGRVFRYSRHAKLEMILDNVPSPNGLVLNADESILYLAATRDNSVWRVPLSPSGSVYKVGRFLSFNGPLGPDGLALTPQGNLVVATPGIGYVWVANEYGEILERFDCRKTGNLPTNIAFDTVKTNRFYITESATGSILAAETQY